MKVVIYKQIHGSHSAASSMDVMLYKEVDMLYPPVVGLEIEFEAGSGRSEIIEEVVYTCDTGTYYCYVASNDELYYADLHKKPMRPIQEIANEYICKGRKVREK